MPNDIRPGLSDTTDTAEGGGKFECHSHARNTADVSAYEFGGCVYGDLQARRLMVVYGDSHAAMWSAALQIIAARTRWRLESFYLPGCPAPDLSYISPQTHVRNVQCSVFHHAALLAIRKLHPKLIIVTSISSELISGDTYATPSQWQMGLEKTFTSLRTGHFAGNDWDIPRWGQDDAVCLASHLHSVQSCAVTSALALSPNLGAELRAAQTNGVRYISPTPVICGTKCEPIINNIRVYLNEFHLTDTFAKYLSGALQNSLGLKR